MNVIYFSPTRTSATIADAIARGMGYTQYNEIDLTYTFPLNPDRLKGITLIAAPVYAGRISKTAVERISLFKGDGSPAIVVAVYGNRHYEDALAELQDIADQAGFHTIAAAAFVGEHSYSRNNMPIAAGRPDQEDLTIAFEFGTAIAQKLTSGNPATPLVVAGNRPYIDKGPFTPATPYTDESLCTQCQTCIDLCPTGAIILEEEIVSDKNQCIKCCACVKFCPNEARIFNTPYTEMLHNKCAERKDPELWIC